jgi:hypothetical protein
VSGIGTTNVTPSNTTVYVLTLKRGAEEVKATNTVGVVEGVAPDWALLDNFDAYPAGLLGAKGWWVDMYGNSMAVVTPTGANRMVKSQLGASGASLRLNSLTVESNQSRTLFFRMIPQGNPASALRHAVGLTDKQVQFYYQLDANVGPVIQPTVNDPAQKPGDWLMAAREAELTSRRFDTNVLQSGAVYAVWIDVTNVPLGDRSPANADRFSVHIQKEGETTRTTIFQDLASDRDLDLDDGLSGGLPTDHLSRIVLGGNSDTDSALFDDFYLSKSGHNATIPRPPGFAGTVPALTIQRAGSQFQILWSEGRLQEADVVPGEWRDVSGATSPYALTAGAGKRFYRAIID